MAKKTTNTKPTYLELNQQLDAVMAKLQDPEVAIDDATHYYEQAVLLIAQLEKHLETAENRVRKMSVQAKLDPGN
jgi:exodeoxyribonuclease VII small subunit